MEDKCELCNNNQVEFVALCEGDEDWTKYKTFHLCGDCLHKKCNSIVDSWTLREWRKASLKIRT